MVLSATRRSVMTLYSGPTDQYSHRVRIVLAEKGVNVDIIDVTNVSVKSLEELAEYNPYATLPTLVDRDLVLYRSDIVMEYLDERFPHPPLMPIYPVAKGRSRLMMHRITRDWYSLLDKLLDRAISEDDKAVSRRELSQSITSVIPVFADMPFFLSEEFSLVDCCIIPLLWRLPVVGVELPPQAKVVHEYAERMFARESFQESLTEAERAMRM